MDIYGARSAFVDVGRRDNTVLFAAHHRVVFDDELIPLPQ
jgi:hypothetical protein